MSSPATDRNLLIALLAFQNNFINRQDMLTAFDAWTGNKSRSIAALLVEQQKLTAAQRDLIEALAAEHVKQHDNDLQQSLAALSSVEPGRDALAEFKDADLQQSLLYLRRPESGATLRERSSASVSAIEVTRSYSFGAQASSGQRFRILRPHAEGGLGKVSVARDVELNRDVALKEIKPKYADEPGARARFTLEAEITGGLEHPGIVPVYGLGTYADGRPYYAMRFVRGNSLKDAIDAFFQKHSSLDSTSMRVVELPRAAYQSLEFRQLLGRFVDVCNAVAYAHARGVLHRDLKPGNIMLGKYGETLVVDWGLAKVTGVADSALEASQAPLTASDSGYSAETIMGSAIGSIGYMSPEQAAGRIDQFGPATDIYLLGATLYHLLTGHPPHRGLPAGELLQQIQAGKFPHPMDANATIPPPLASICTKAMSLAIGDRNCNAAELAQDVERYLADERVMAYDEPPSVRVRRWLRKHPKSVGTLAATLLVGLASSLAIAAVVSNNSRVVAEKNSQLARQNAALIKSIQAEKEAKEDALAVLGFFQDHAWAATYDSAGNLDAALPHYERMFELMKAKLGAEHPATLNAMGNLAVVYIKLKRFDEAKPLFEAVISGLRHHLRGNEMILAGALIGIASQLIENGQFPAAEIYFREILAIRERNVPDDWSVFSAKSLLGAALAGQKRFEEADPLLLEGYEGIKQRTPAGSRNITSAIRRLITHYTDWGKPAEAAKWQAELNAANDFR